MVAELPSLSAIPAGIGQMRAEMIRLPQVQCPVVHRFTPGLYIREVFIPAGTCVVSAIHRIEHPFVVSLGEIMVISENEGPVVYRAPYCGITLPGTQRAVHALTDTVWTTFHVTDETDVEKICHAILEPEEIPGFTPQWRNSIPKLT